MCLALSSGKCAYQNSKVVRMSKQGINCVSLMLFRNMLGGEMPLGKKPQGRTYKQFQSQGQGHRNAHEHVIHKSTAMHSLNAIA